MISGMDATAAERLSIDHEALERLCRRHHIRRLAFFGSILRDDFGPQSDIDVLVEFEPAHTPGLGFFEIEAELEHVLGRRVDLNTPEDLSPAFRERVLAEAEPQYVGT